MDEYIWFSLFLASLYILYLGCIISRLKDKIKEFDTILSEHKKGYRVSELVWQMECSRLHHELITLRKQCSNYENILKDCLDTTNNFLHVLPRWGTIIDVIIIEDAKTLVSKLEKLLDISSEE